MSQGEQVTVDKLKFLQVLNVVKVAIAQNDNMEGSENFTFRDAIVFAGNDKTAISAPLNTHFPLDVTVNAEQLIETCKKTKTKNIKMAVKDNGLWMKAGNSQFCINGEQASIGEDFTALSLDSFIRLPTTFPDAINICATSCHPEEAALSMIRIMGRYAYSTDKKRISRYDMGDGADAIFPEQIFINPVAKEFISKHSPHSYHTTPGWIHFVTENGVIYSIRTMSTRYPDILYLLNPLENTEVLRWPVNINEILGRAILYAEGRTNDEKTVVVQLLETGAMYFRAANQKKGRFVERADVTPVSREYNFTIGIAMLESVVESIEEFTANETMVRMTSPNYTNVTMLAKAKSND